MKVASAAKCGYLYIRLYGVTWRKSGTLILKAFRYYFSWCLLFALSNRCIILCWYVSVNNYMFWQVWPLRYNLQTKSNISLVYEWYIPETPCSALKLRKYGRPDKHLTTHFIQCIMLGYIKHRKDLMKELICIQYLTAQKSEIRLLIFNSVCTSQATQHLSITEPRYLMRFWETIAIFCENHTRRTITFFEVLKLGWWSVFLPPFFKGLNTLARFHAHNITQWNTNSC